MTAQALADWFCCGIIQKGKRCKTKVITPKRFCPNHKAQESLLIESESEDDSVTKSDVLDEQDGTINELEVFHNYITEKSIESQLYSSSNVGRCVVKCKSGAEICENIWVHSPYQGVDWTCYFHSHSIQPSAHYKPVLTASVPEDARYDEKDCRIDSKIELAEICKFSSFNHKYFKSKSIIIIFDFLACVAVLIWP